ncbi:MAG: helix-turn-helix transcriptional regulator [Lachnospiraceae bacterium]|nr:helix-turn-helix transcriptional regulator [Lachnospiraceae bacterium]
MKRKYPVIDMLRTGQNIKRIMQAKGLSVKDVQNFLGFSTPQGIYHWFDGKTMPTLDNMYALSELFRMPVDAIMRGNRKYVYVPFIDPSYLRLYVYHEKIMQLQIA